MTTTTTTTNARNPEPRASTLPYATTIPAQNKLWKKKTTHDTIRKILYLLCGIITHSLLCVKMNSDSDSFEQDDESYDEQDEESYDEEQHDQLPNVDEYKAQVGHREQKPSFWGTFCCLTILTIVVTVVAVVLAQLKEGIGRATKNAHPFIHYNSEKFLQVKEYVTTVRGISHQDNFEVDTSPTFIAAQWMAHGDEANHTVPQVADLSYDERFALAVLYFATGGHKDWHYEVNFMGKGHVCTWFNSYTKLSGEQDVFGVSGCKNDEKGRMYPSVLHLSTSFFFVKIFRVSINTNLILLFLFCKTTRRCWAFRLHSRGSQRYASSRNDDA
jgi:hypothetical protein